MGCLADTGLAPARRRHQTADQAAHHPSRCANNPIAPFRQPPPPDSLRALHVSTAARWFPQSQSQYPVSRVPMYLPEVQKAREAVSPGHR